MSGLVGWWPLHGHSGEAQDLSGEGNTGTVNGATQGVWGRGGLTAYSFDGSDDEVVVDSVDSEITAPVTVSLWARKNSTNAAQSFDHGNGRFYIGYEINGTNGYEFDIYDGSSHTTIVSGDTTTDGWMHHVGVFSGGFMRYYIDSELVGAKSVSSIGSSVEGTTIGGSADSSNHFDGYISNVRVYDHALSPQEIQTLYDWGSGDYTTPSLHDGSDSGAVSRYEFESGSVTADDWGSNTLTDNTSAGTTTDNVYGTEAKSFDGSDDSMDLSSAIVGGQSDTTVSMWANPADFSSPYYMYSEGDSSDDTPILGIIANSSNEFRFLLKNDSGTSSDIYSGETYGSDSWHHVVAIIDDTAGVAKLFVNGTKKAEANLPGGSFSYDVTRIGSLQRTSESNYYNGDIDDVRIYDRVLSAEEVAQLYREKHGRDMRDRTVMY